MAARKNQVRRIIIFLLVGLLILKVISFVIDFGVRRSDLAQTGKVNEVINHLIDPDVMIFGPSVSEMSISPAIIKERTGLSAYNCSISGTRFMQYKGLIDEFVSYSKNDKVIVLAESYFSFEKIDALTSAEFYLSHIDNNNLYQSLYSIQPDLMWKCRHIPFYKYAAVTHVYYKNSVIGWKNFLKKTYPVDTLQGWTPVDRGWEADQDEVVRQIAPFKIAIDSGIVKRYIDIIGKLKRDGKTVVLLLCPPYTKVLNTITDFSPLRAELTRIATTTGARFVDFSTSSICSDKSLYYNTNHLNLKGSRIFSAALADSLNMIVAGQDNHAMR